MDSKIRILCFLLFISIIILSGCITKQGESNINNKPSIYKPKAKSSLSKVREIPDDANLFVVPYTSYLNLSIGKIVSYENYETEDYKIPIGSSVLVEIFRDRKKVFSKTFKVREEDRGIFGNVKLPLSKDAYGVGVLECGELEVTLTLPDGKKFFKNLKLHSLPQFPPEEFGEAIDRLLEELRSASEQEFQKNAKIINETHEYKGFKMTLEKVGYYVVWEKGGYYLARWERKGYIDEKDLILIGRVEDLYEKSLWLRLDFKVDNDTNEVALIDFGWNFATIQGNEILPGGYIVPTTNMYDANYRILRGSYIKIPPKTTKRISVFPFTQEGTPPLNIKYSAGKGYPWKRFEWTISIEKNISNK